MTYILNILTAEKGFDLLILLAVTTAKATFLLGFAALLCLVFRRFSAATRHLVWVSVLCASLLLPILSFVKIWEISILPMPTATLNTPATNELNQNNELSATPKLQTSQEKGKADLFKTKNNRNLEVVSDNKFFREPLLIPNISQLQTSPEQKNVPSLFPQIINLLLGIWIIGAFLFFFRLATGIISTNLLAHNTVEFENPSLTKLFSTLLIELNLKDNVRLLRSERTLMPIVCGIWRPVVILPAIAESWSEERCRMVLLHELTHIARRDCLTQMLAQLGCVFYWFNPFVWLAARRLRIEREQACDEFVLSLGTKPSDYAHHLLEIARSIQKKEGSVFEWSPTTTVAMAQKSQLEERLLAILNPKGGNHRLSNLITVSLMLFIGVLFLSLVVIHPTSASADNSQIAISSKAEGATEDKSFLNLFSETKPQPQDKIVKELTDKNEINIDLEKNIEKQIENNLQVEQVTKQNGLPDVAQNIPQTEKNEQNININPNANPNPIPNPNPFVNIGFSPEKQTETTAQKQSEDFIEEMASVGYKNLTVDELINLKSVGVTADYVKGLRALGIDNLTVKELVNLRAVGVTPKYIEEIRNAGYKDLAAKELSNLRALGVTSAFISKFRDAGYNDLTVRNLVDLKASGITLEFINTINSMGFGKLSLKELTNLKFIGVTPEFIKLARSRLGDDLTLKQIIGLKTSGILKDKEKDKQ